MNFAKIKNDILGKEYELSIAYVTEKKSRELNKKYRKKDRATNVLSFSLRGSMGELILCRPVIQKEAGKLGKTSAAWLGFLVIHGMLHLKGMKHSATMEKAENFYCQKYDTKYFSGDRHRLDDHKGSGRRVRQRRAERAKSQDYRRG